MGSFNVNDEFRVIVWREKLGEKNPLAFPLGDELEKMDRRIEVLDADVDAVAEIRIVTREDDRYIAKVVSKFSPNSQEWKNAKETLEVNHDLEMEVTDQSENPRLMIRSTSDYENQWQEQRKMIMDQLPGRTWMTICVIL